MAESTFDVGHLLGHVQDAYHFEVPHYIAEDGKLPIPQPFGTLTKTAHGYEPESGFLITKFMVLEAVAALLIAVCFIWVAGRLRTGSRPKGRVWNLFEAFLVFLRDEVARPAIGKHDADRFLPYLWTLFFFTLCCNLLGLLPWSGTPTGALSVTGVLAALTFCVVLGAGMLKMGVTGFWLGLVPPMELPWRQLDYTLKPLIFVIELAGLLVKHFVLAVRLFANMFAGHLVLAVIVGFIAQTGKSLLWFGVMPASVGGAVALCLLELLVAFLQAYIITFLSALFIGMAVHPH